MSELTDKLEGFRTQLEELDQKLSGEALNDMNLYKSLMQERSHLAPVVDKLTEMRNLEKEIEDSKELIKAGEDPELVEMAKEELSNLEKDYETKEKECRILLIPPDPLEGKNIIMEIRAGTGGDEASLFAADIFRMYSHYAEKQRWKMEIMSSSESGIGGYNRGN